MTTSTGHACQFTGDNLDDVAALGVHVIPHATQNAAVIFANDGDLDPVGTIAPGQTVIVDTDGVRIAGVPDVTALTLPAADQFDPATAKVDEVVEYLHNADDPAEVDRVIEAEKNGKARKSLVGDPAE